MVRVVSALLSSAYQAGGGRISGRRRPTATHIVFGFLLIIASGCAIVPRSRMDECQQLTQTLRSENARMKDRVLALQGQNRDYAERAVDDAKRLAIQDEAIERLEHSVQAYQDERTRLEAAYQQLASSLAATEPAIEGRPAPSPSSAARSDEPQRAAAARGSKGANVTADPLPR
jgi:hypothetical protein